MVYSAKIVQRNIEILVTVISSGDSPIRENLLFSQSEKNLVKVAVILSILPTIPGVLCVHCQYRVGLETPLQKLSV